MDEEPLRHSPLALDPPERQAFLNYIFIKMALGFHEGMPSCQQQIKCGRIGAKMSQYKNPTWWTKENDSTWERTKAAFKRDWDQTKHDVGANEPDTNQNVKDTVKQAAGKEAIPPRGQPSYEEAESAYRYGYGANSHYGKKYQKWDSELEKELRGEWSSTYPEHANNWDADAEYVRSGWKSSTNPKHN
ncbi:MAG TPA: hypothetical protein VGO59_17615 [Verrucomicrobiae bacterium]|jgi:hypothetical protein